MGAQQATSSWDQSTFETIQKRLNGQVERLRDGLDVLNKRRKTAFGSIPTQLLTTEHVISEHNCTPIDMVAVGDRFLFGYNVRFGLKTETLLEDVFSVHRWDGSSMIQEDLSLIESQRFRDDFKSLYKYYKHTRLYKFSLIGPYLFMVFQVGQHRQDIKTFKWVLNDGRLEYVDNRSDHEFAFPQQFDFQWTKTTRDAHSNGPFPHVSIADRVFVETVGGDLTIKIEDNTESGEGIYAEPVDHLEQSLDDAEIYYACLGHLILLKIKPFQEKQFRYLIFNEKLKTVHRADGIQDCCLVLPGDAGLVYASGTYAVTGAAREFENQVSGLVFEKRIAAANGEDYLYLFFQPETAVYVLMTYNTISGSMGNPIQCHGHSLFDDGQLLFFRADDEPQKHHAIQVWQTPFSKNPAIAGDDADALIVKIGNRDLVRFLAESHELVQVIDEGRLHESYFRDLVKGVDEITEGFHWLAQTDVDLLGPLTEVRNTAQQAIDVYEKVLEYQRDARTSQQQLGKEVAKTLQQGRSPKDNVGDYLKALNDLRHTKGAVEGLKEKPYVDLEQLDQLSDSIAEAIQSCTDQLVEFLQTDSAFEPFTVTLEELEQELTSIDKSASGRLLQERSQQLTADLELLLDILNRIEVADATMISGILERLTGFFQQLNQFQSRLHQSIQSFSEQENRVAFSAQITLFQQNLAHLIDASASPETCDQNMNRLMLHLEEMETRFADNERFLVTLTERREELIAAFESRKFSLVEKRNQQAHGVYAASERILEGIQRRLLGSENESEINSFLAADLMVEKFRTNVDRLRQLDDQVRAEELESRLKSLREESMRQWRDKRDLFTAENTIQLGRHRFRVQATSLELSLVQKQDQWGVQISGTQFFEPLEDHPLDPFKDVWDLEQAIESRQLYAGCVLAHEVIEGASQNLGKQPIDWQALVKEAVAERAFDGYVRGVHDRDAARIAPAIWNQRLELKTLVYSPAVRGRTRFAWHQLISAEQRSHLSTCAMAFQSLELNPAIAIPSFVLDQCRSVLKPHDAFLGDLEEAARFLAHALLDDALRTVSRAVFDEAIEFKTQLKHRALSATFKKAVTALNHHREAQWELCLNWLARFGVKSAEIEELTAMLLCPVESWLPNPAEELLQVDGLVGNHGSLESGSLTVSYRTLLAQLRDHRERIRPLYESFQQAKRSLIDTWHQHMQLERFKARVLTSFVRNRLIDEVYLPLLGNNLAKQIGAAGDQKRTDLMGLLLLVSPPGYGKTTLMEYLAHRLGLVFVKINGPSIGHAVTSLDPAEAPHASAREELEKLNLAFQLGDNVMIYLDDIQHCNPELLQKFIALCDAQRRIEGVWKGKPVSYDLRGRKVCVVMAGNPYTESGDRFQIPDMLANRADTYNLGEVIGGQRDAFARSYIENAMTSNATLAQIARQFPRDIHHLIDVAEKKAEYDPTKVEGDHARGLIEDAIKVVGKLIELRDRLLLVNQAYMVSAAQSDEYRTEPPFKLQGSYRNMNKLAEKVLAITNQSELDGILRDHYENEAQTLAKGAESNLLKFCDLMGWQTDEQRKRWQEIKQAYARNAVFRSAGADNPAAQIVNQMTLFHEGLTHIGKVLRAGVKRMANEAPVMEFPKQIQSQWSESQWQQLLAVLQTMNPKEEEEWVVDRETGLPAGFLARHGFELKKQGGSRFEIRREDGPLVELNARGTQLSFAVDLGQLGADENEQLIKKLRALNRRIYPVSFSAKGLKDGGHQLNLAVSVEKADMNGLKWLAIFDALEKASNYATKILQSD